MQGTGGGGGAGSQGGGTGAAGGGYAIGFEAVFQSDAWEGFKEERNVEAELKWQRVVNGETAKNEAFTERVLGLQELKVFAFMKGGSLYIQMGHGLAKFYSIYGTVPELDGKVLMFVGDRGATRDPMPLQPPVQNTWKWITVNVATDEDALLVFAQSAGGTGLWQPGGGNHTTQDVKVPYILALPGVLVEFIHRKGGQCRPHELLGEANRLAGEYTIPVDDWSLVNKWCMVAAQAREGRRTEVQS